MSDLRAQVTLSDATIHNPKEIRHFMRIRPVSRRVRVRLGDVLLAESTNARRLTEVGRDVYDPAFYLPRKDVRITLQRVDKQTHCPLKGDASYFDVLDADGEMQFDAAFVASIGELKAKGSDVAGQANVMIFPNLDAGNIGYKITQRLGGYSAIGPVLQGLAKPANDLSRGCTADDVAEMIAVTCLQAGHA